MSKHQTQSHVGLSQCGTLAENHSMVMVKGTSLWSGEKVLRYFAAYIPKNTKTKRKMRICDEGQETPNKPLGKAFMDKMGEIGEGQKDEQGENGGMVMFSSVPRPLSVCGLSVVNEMF